MKLIKLVLLPLLTLFVIKLNAQTSDSIPIHQTFTINSKLIGEMRTINVWIPASYQINTDSLPVLYMADGGVNEDFPHMANTMAKLVAAKKIPPFMLVGIENTQRRRDLTGFTSVKKDKEIAPSVGESGKFRSFINEELFPEINNRYRTTNKRGIIGESLSGLFVVETFIFHPEMFDYYIAFDPSLWWNNKYLVRTAEEHLNHLPKGQPKKLWFAGSNAKDISSATKPLSKILEAQKIPTLIWHYANEPKEQHHTIFRATKEKALIWTLNDNI